MLKDFDPSAPEIVAKGKLNFFFSCSGFIIIMFFGSRKNDTGTRGRSACTGTI
jgi:hypothetical protein